MGQPGFVSVSQAKLSHTEAPIEKMKRAQFSEPVKSRVPST